MDSATAEWTMDSAEKSLDSATAEWTVDSAERSLDSAEWNHGL